MADLLLRLVGEDAASGPFDSVAGAAKRVGAELIKLGEDAIRSSEEQAKADRQLQRVAGDLTDTFKAQASAMQEQLGVSDDMVQGLQTMLLRFGEAPANVEATTKAILDFSAATGEDAVSATKAMLTGVQSGKSVFKDLGLEYEKTGTATKDLANVTDALAKKFAGSAAVEADSLSGQARKAHEAIGELKEAVGGLITEFIQKSGAVDTFTDALKGMQLALFGGSAATNLKTQQRVALQDELDYLEKHYAQLVHLRETDAESYTRMISGMGTLAKSPGDEFTRIKQLREQLAALDADLKKTANLPTEGSDRPTGKGPAEEKLAGIAKAAKSEAELQEEFDQAKRLKEFGTYEENIADAKKESEGLLRVQQEGQKHEMEEQDKAAAELEKQRKKDVEARDKYLEEDGKHWVDGIKRNQDAVAEQNRKFESEMTTAGMKIGNALSSALVSAVEAAMDGGEFDVLGAVADVAFAVAAIAADAIISIYAENPALGQAVGAGIGAIGGLEHHARASAWKSEQAAKKHHDGEWIEPQRYHSGGMILGTDEVPIIGQVGEAVFSRADVARNGGRSGIEAIRRGGGGGNGPNIYISAMDTQSIQESFQDKSGRGLVDAVRTGRGPLALLFEG